MKAFIDLGTNTFHCQIASFENGNYISLYYDKIFVKIGEGGIAKGLLTDQAIERALTALQNFYEKIKAYGVHQVIATGTSAMRNADNASVLIDKMKNWGWDVQIIGGKREAELIYKGILLDTTIPISSDKLIMDIGGGSVEFIIGEEEEIKWSQSFEIGAQRLKDEFHNNDPIDSLSIDKLLQFLEKTLKPLKEAIKNYNPQMFIGSSGTFDTVLSIRNENENRTDNLVSVKDFEQIKQLFIKSTFSQRLKLKGMVEERAEMIVTASLLLDFVLRISLIPEFFVSSNALKEGLIYEEIQRLKA